MANLCNSFFDSSCAEKQIARWRHQRLKCKCSVRIDGDHCSDRNTSVDMLGSVVELFAKIDGLHTALTKRWTDRRRRCRLAGFYQQSYNSLFSLFCCFRHVAMEGCLWLSGRHCKSRWQGAASSGAYRSFCFSLCFEEIASRLRSKSVVIQYRIEIWRKLTMDIIAAYRIQFKGWFKARN